MTLSLKPVVVAGSEKTKDKQMTALAHASVANEMRDTCRA